MNEFVYGNKDRIFVNTDMGCNSNCSYCYLPALNIKHAKKKISVGEAIGLVENLKYYKRGKNGTIISIGCYSECMDQENKEDTFQIIEYFLKQGNYVQLATKKQIDSDFLKRLSEFQNEKRQLWIYVSLPVITESDKMEIGTDIPEKRIKNFALCKQFGINCALYIKPYIDGVTDKDVDKYIDIINRFNIPAIVGEMLSVDEKGEEALVGEKRLYGYKMEGMDSFVRQLKRVTEVYLHSTECIDKEEKFYNEYNSDNTTGNFYINTNM